MIDRLDDSTVFNRIDSKPWYWQILVQPIAIQGAVGPVQIFGNDIWCDQCPPSPPQLMENVRRLVMEFVMANNEKQRRHNSKWEHNPVITSCGLFLAHKDDRTELTM